MLNYYKELIYFVQKFSGVDKEFASDVVQETYVKVMEIDSKHVVNNHRAFLYKVARNIVIDESRRQKRIQNVIFEEDEHMIPKVEQPEHITLEEARNQDLRIIIDTLPSRSKQAFVLHVLKGYSRQTIAEMMGISINAVQKHITRASKKIQEQIDLDEWELYE